MTTESESTAQNGTPEAGSEKGKMSSSSSYFNKMDALLSLTIGAGGVILFYFVPAMSVFAIAPIAGIVFAGMTAIGCLVYNFDTNRQKGMAEKYLASKAKNLIRSQEEPVVFYTVEPNDSGILSCLRKNKKKVSFEKQARYFEQTGGDNCRSYLAQINDDVSKLRAASSEKEQDEVTVFKKNPPVIQNQAKLDQVNKDYFNYYRR